MQLRFHLFLRLLLRFQPPGRGLYIRCDRRAPAVHPGQSGFCCGAVKRQRMQRIAAGLVCLRRRLHRWQGAACLVLYFLYLAAVSFAPRAGA